MDGASLFGPLHLAVSETVDQVIVHHPDRLHVGVDDGRADEAEPALLEILAERVGLRGSRWDFLGPFPAIQQWVTIDEAPAVGIEAPKLVLDGEELARVAHRGFNLTAIADDRR